MDILHISSFVGNIGDNASHFGQRMVINEFFDKECSYSELEIRKTYANYLFEDKVLLDKEFSDYCNRFDLILIGGGNFLEPFDGSPCFLRIPFEPEFVEHIYKPVVFGSVGLVPSREMGDRTLEGAVETYRDLTSKQNIHIALRNDGSLNWLESVAPDVASQCVSVFDSAFFYDRNIACEEVILALPQPYVAVNVSGDQLWVASHGSKKKYRDLLASIASALTFLIESSGLNLVFVPHIHNDLDAIVGITSIMPDYWVRAHVAVSPSVQGFSGSDLALNVYRQAQAVIGMRFHANVCSVSMKRPIFPLVALDRVHAMLDSLNMCHLGVDLRDQLPDFRKKLVSEFLPDLSKGLADDGLLRREKERTKSVYIRILNNCSE